MHSHLPNALLVQHLIASGRHFQPFLKGLNPLRRDDFELTKNLVASLIFRGYLNSLESKKPAKSFPQINFHPLISKAFKASMNTAKRKQIQLKALKYID
jgi:hypothetical protein